MRALVVLISIALSTASSMKNCTAAQLDCKSSCAVALPSVPVARGLAIHKMCRKCSCRRCSQCADILRASSKAGGNAEAMADGAGHAASTTSKAATWMRERINALPSSVMTMLSATTLPLERLKTGPQFIAGETKKKGKHRNGEKHPVGKHKKEKST